MKGYDTSKVTMLIRDAFNNIVDNEQGSMELQRKNGDYIVAQYEKWLDELVNFNEHFMLHPDEKAGTELAVLYAYFTYACAANGCLQNGYVLYMLGSDIVEKYGNNREQSTFCNAGAFCAQHFSTTPQSFDEYFLALMKERARKYILYLGNMVDESCKIEQEYACTINVTVLELLRRAKIFEAYVTTENMTRYAAEFYPYVADIYVALSNISYGVFGFTDYCKDCLNKAIKYAKLSDNVQMLRAVEGHAAYLADMAKGSINDKAIKSPEEFMLICYQQFREIAVKHGLVDKEMSEIKLQELGKKQALKILQDKQLAKEAGDDLAFYYLSVLIGCLQSGIAVGVRDEADAKVLNSYVDMLADKNYRLNEAAPLLAGRLKISAQAFQSLSLELFAKWQQLHKPYLELKDHRMHTLCSMAAAFLLGVEIMRKK